MYPNHLGQMTKLGGRDSLNHIVYVVITVTVLTVAARLEFLLVPTGIWRDEATSYFESALPTIGLLIERIRVSEINPPLFFLALHTWIALAGRTAFAMRFLPYAFGVAALAVLFVLARRGMDRYEAVLGLAFVAANVLTVTTASELRPYSLAALLVSVSVYGMERYLCTEKLPYLAIVTVSNIALAYTTYVGSIAIVAITLVGTYLARSRKARASIPAMACALPLICALPLLPLEHVQAASNLVAVTKPNLRPGDFLAYASRALPAYTLEPRKPQMLCGLVTVAALAGVLLKCSWRRRPSDSDIPLVLSAGVFVLTAVGVAAMGLETPRYISPVAPLGALSLGFIVYRAIAIVRHRYGTLANALLVLSIFVPLLWQYVIVSRIAAYPKSSLEAVAKRYPTQGSPSLAIIVAPDFAAQTLAYYEGSIQHVYGFARWNDPDVFDLRGYDVVWNSPSLIPETLVRIRRLADAGVSRLVVVRLEPKYTGLPVTGQKYELVDALLEKIGRRYGVPQKVYYSAQVEDSTAYVYRI